MLYNDRMVECYHDHLGWQLTTRADGAYAADDWSPERILRWAGAIGPETGEGEHPEHCIINLHRVLRSACGSGQPCMAEAEQLSANQPSLPLHANIRGNDYYHSKEER